eukprot:SM000013S26364  [mRNA]  locus=s13:122:3831:+ [translate_table: standard]
MSYNRLQMNPQKPTCKLLSTHNDYSLMEHLPVADTSVITQIRDPVDRFLSAYEFAIEVGSRNVAKGGGPTTLQVWPWNFLAPFMERDMVLRRNADTKPPAQSNDARNSFDVPQTVIPLHEFVKHPIATELLHNGQTLQMAGLTNNSWTDGAKELRDCIVQRPELGTLALDVAKARLQQMLHVGLTEEHAVSMQLLAALLGRPLSSRAHAVGGLARGNMTGRIVLTQEQQEFRRRGMEHRQAWLKQHRLLQQQHLAGQSAHIEQPKLKLRRSLLQLDPIGGGDGGQAVTHVQTVDLAPPHNNAVTRRKMDILSNYNNCVNLQRSRYKATRRTVLARTGTLNFTHEARSLISPAIMEDIANRNKLDAELLKFARKIFKERKARFKDRMQKALILHTQMDKQNELPFANAGDMMSHAMIMQEGANNARQQGRGVPPISSTQQLQPAVSEELAHMSVNREQQAEQVGGSPLPAQSTDRSAASGGNANSHVNIDPSRVTENGESEDAATDFSIGQVPDLLAAKERQKTMRKPQSIAWILHRTTKPRMSSLNVIATFASVSCLLLVLISRALNWKKSSLSGLAHRITSPPHAHKMV